MAQASSVGNVGRVAGQGSTTQTPGGGKGVTPGWGRQAHAMKLTKEVTQLSQGFFFFYWRASEQHELLGLTPWLKWRRSIYPHWELIAFIHRICECRCVCRSAHTHTHTRAHYSQTWFVPWSRLSLQKWQHMENQAKLVHTSITSTCSHLPSICVSVPHPSIQHFSAFAFCLFPCPSTLCSRLSPLLLFCYLERPQQD